MIRVLFVCLGNICRSPLAEGIFRDVVERADLAHRFEIDSAGTGAWHAGEPPDVRSVETARRHGLDISGQRARQVKPSDFHEFHYIVAMDGSNLEDLLRRPKASGTAHVMRLLDDVPEVRVRDVPDPYFGGDDGFEHVFQLVSRGCEALLARIRAERVT